MRLRCLLISFVVFTHSAASGQGEISQEQIAILIPDSLAHTTTGIAAFMNAHYKSREERISAIYSWIIHNIRYDPDSIHRVILDQDQEEKATWALRRRKGVCENFAALFTALCRKSGISCYSVEGVTKQRGSVDRAGHAWCAALVQGRWLFYDPTWDAGFRMSGDFKNRIAMSYFGVAPARFIESHLPFDPLFQFLDYPVTYQEFVNGDASKKDRRFIFNVRDSIANYQGLDLLSRYLSTLNRIQNSGWPASKVRTKISQLKMEVEIIRQERDMDLYQSAVSDCNEAIALLNTLLSYRNTQSQRPGEKEMHELLNTIDQRIASAGNKLDTVNRSAATLVLNTGGIQEKLDHLSAKVREERAYVKDYRVTLK